MKELFSAEVEGTLSDDGLELLDDDGNQMVLEDVFYPIDVNGDHIDFDAVCEDSRGKKVRMTFKVEEI